MDKSTHLENVHLNLGDTAVGSLALRPWQEGDEPALVKHGNNYRIWQNVRDRFPHPYTMKDAQLWVQVADKDSSSLNLAITLNDEAVGAIGVSFKDDVYHQTAEIGYWLGEAYWYHGLASRAVQALTEYVLAHTDICRIYAGVFEHNTASSRVLEKAGYALEARLRKSITKEGRTVDELIYARIKD
jgi:RimJ/RimL family protein N-acetyltransferase